MDYNHKIEIVMTRKLRHFVVPFRSVAVFLLVKMLIVVGHMNIFGVHISQMMPIGTDSFK